LRQGLPLPEFTDFPVQLAEPENVPETEGKPETTEPTVVVLEQPPARDDDGLITPFSNQAAIPVIAPELDEASAFDSGEEPLIPEEEQVEDLEEMLADRQDEIRTLEEQMQTMAEQLREAEANIQRLLDAAENTQTASTTITTVTGSDTSGTSSATDPTAGSDNSGVLKISVGVLGLLLLLSAGYIWKLRREKDAEDWDELEDMDIPEDFDIEDEFDQPAFGMAAMPAVKDDHDHEFEYEYDEDEYLAIVDYPDTLPEEGYLDAEEDESTDSLQYRRHGTLLNEVNEDISAAAYLLDNEEDSDSGDNEGDNKA
jgi:hypothetical protein